MNGKVVIITGATDGVGKVTARGLAGMGATTLIVGRDPEKTSRVAHEIRSATGNEQVHALVADLSSQEQIHGLAKAVRQRYARLDVLVNNAGAIFMKRSLSVDQIEMTFALNHLGYFLLTHLLRDMLQASRPARVINVSSEGHRGARLNFANLQNERGYTAWGAYRQSKLANLYFTYGLAATLDESGVTVNALHPGFVASNFGKSNAGIFRPLFGLFQIGAISPEEGALTSIYLASSPKVEGVTGKYFIKNQVVPSSVTSYDMDSARKLWDCSLEMVSLQ